MTNSTTPSVSLRLASGNFRNNIVYGPDDDVLYWIETEKTHILGGTTGPTLIYRPTEKEGKELVAEMHFHRISTSTINYQGVTRDLTDMFPKKGWSGCSRLMPSPMGDCKWNSGNLIPELYDPSGRSILSLQIEFSRLPQIFTSHDGDFARSNGICRSHYDGLDHHYAGYRGYDECCCRGRGLVIWR